MNMEQRRKPSSLHLVERHSLDVWRSQIEQMLVYLGWSLQLDYYYLVQTKVREC